MIKQIDKFLIEYNKNSIKNEYKITMPKYSEILSVELYKNNIICIWALITPNIEIFEDRLFEIYKINDLINCINKHYKRTYIGTCKYGKNIKHVFEKLNN